MPLLLNKYYSGEQIKKNETGGACSIYEGEERAYRDWVSEPKRKPPRRPSRRWENDIKMYLEKKTGCEEGN